jgi:type IV pilus assembly protein PilN
MIKVNLLSPEKKEIGGMGGEAPSFDEEREKKINPIAALGAVLITVGIIAYLYFTQGGVIEEKKQLLQERQARKTQLEGVLKKVSELEKTKKTLDRKVKLITELKGRQQDAVIMMDQLLNALPDWVWLDDLSFSGRTLNLKGKAIGNNLIADFINNLKGTGSFYDINFPGSSLQKQGGLDVFTFRISCSYKEKSTATGKNKKKAG